MVGPKGASINGDELLTVWLHQKGTGRLVYREVSNAGFESQPKDDI